MKENEVMEKTLERISDKKQCPACGKYVEEHRRICPECTAEFAYRIRESTLVKFSLIFVALGIVFFLIAAFWGSNVTDIDDIDTDDNFTIMNFEGKVTSSPRYYPIKYNDYGEMKFYLNDTTGEIQVYCGSEVTEELIKGGNIPALGDTVTVTGRVLYIEGVSDNTEDIRISSAGITTYGGVEKEGISSAFRRVEVIYEDNLEISKRLYSVKSISSVAGKPKNTYEEGVKVMMSGTVISEITNYSTAYQFTIGDLASEDKLLVYIPKALVHLAGIELYSDKDPVFNLKPGSEMTILGALEYYESSYGPQYDKWELIPTSVGNKVKIDYKGESIGSFRVTEEGEGFTVDMLMSNKDMFKGEQVHLQNVIVSKNDQKLFVKDSGGQHELYVFTYDFDALDYLDVGTNVELWGEFIQYNQEWEIKLGDPSDIKEVV